MSAISLSSFNSFRPVQGAMLSSAQQAPRGGAAFGSSAPVRGGNVAGNSAAYCPTCVGGGARAGAADSSSYCPTCNRAGGAQANVGGARFGAAQTGAVNANSAQQGGRICVGCAYQGR